MNGGVVLVHGAMHGSWCWSRLIPLLAVPAVAVDLPGRSADGRPANRSAVGLRDYQDAIVDAAERSGFDRVILVGHSLAGLSVPGADRGADVRLDRSEAAARVHASR